MLFLTKTNIKIKNKFNNVAIILKSLIIQLKLLKFFN